MLRILTLELPFSIGSDAAILMFDVTRPDSYKHIETIVDKLHRVVSDDIPKVLVANKVTRFISD